MCAGARYVAASEDERSRACRTSGGQMKLITRVLSRRTVSFRKRRQRCEVQVNTRCQAELRGEGRVRFTHSKMVVNFGLAAP